MGQVRQAVDHADRAIARAARLAPHAEALSLAWAQSCASRLYLLLDRPHAAIAHAEQAIEIGTAHGYTTPVQEGRLELAMALIARGDLAAGVNQLAQGTEAWKVGGYEIDRSYWLAALADGYGRQGDHKGALATLDAAAAHVDHHGERIWAAEIARVRGVLLFGHSPAAVEH